MESSLNSILKKIGCKDLKATEERFMEDKQFYLEIVADLLNHQNFEKLKEPLLKQDAKVAYEIAHALKGLIGNCGITSMYETIVSIVEPLRNGITTDLLDKYELLLLQRDQMKMLLKETKDKE